MAAQVVRKSLKDQIKKILIERIVDGRLVPGDRIKEMQVAKELGTSQAPVREAIRCLETLGYIEHIPHVGAMVKSFNRQEVEEAYQVREAVELYAVARMHTNRKRLIETLDHCLEEMRKAVEIREIPRFTKADNQFHRAIVDYSGNKTMLAVWDSLKIQMQVVATLVEAAMPLKIIYHLHPPIIEALKRDCCNEASRILADHYQRIGVFWKEAKNTEKVA